MFFHGFVLIIVMTSGGSLGVKQVSVSWSNMEVHRPLGTQPLFPVWWLMLENVMELIRHIERKKKEREREREREREEREREEEEERKKDVIVEYAALLRHKH